MRVCVHLYTCAYMCFYTHLLCAQHTNFVDPFHKSVLFQHKNVDHMYVCMQMLCPFIQMHMLYTYTWSILVKLSYHTDTCAHTWYVHLHTSIHVVTKLCEQSFYVSVHSHVHKKLHMHADMCVCVWVCIYVYFLHARYAYVHVRVGVVNYPATCMRVCVCVCVCVGAQPSSYMHVCKCVCMCIRPCMRDVHAYIALESVLCVFMRAYNLCIRYIYSTKKWIFVSWPFSLNPMRTRIHICRCIRSSIYVFESEVHVLA
jgi:hypothetical protein